MLPEAVNYPERGRDLPGSERGGGGGGGDDTSGSEVEGIFMGYVWSTDDSCRVKTMFMLKADILRISSIFVFFLSVC